MADALISPPVQSITAEDILSSLRDLDRESNELKKQFLTGALQKAEYENKLLILKRRRNQSISKLRELLKTDAEHSRQLRFGLYGSRIVQLLLSGFIGGMVQELTPTFDSDRKVRYPIVENLDEITPGSNPQEILDELAYAGILERKLYERLACCPKCGSHSAVFLRLKCPECGSLQLESSKLLEHLVCGAVHEFDEFASDDQIRCPSCKEQLVQEGEDFRVVGTFNRCESCKVHFDMPAQKFACRKCQEEFELKDVSYYDTYSYSLNNEILPEVKATVGLPILKSALEELGFKVELPGTIIGSSGMIHNFTLTGNKNGRTVAIDVVESEGEVGEKDLFAAYTKMIDSKSTTGVLVAIPLLSSRAKEFAAKAFSKGDIALIEANGPAQAVQQLKLRLQSTN